MHAFGGERCACGVARVLGPHNVAASGGHFAGLHIWASRFVDSRSEFDICQVEAKNEKCDRHDESVEPAKRTADSDYKLLRIFLAQT